jgi:hypothetical protein
MNIKSKYFNDLWGNEDYSVSNIGYSKEEIKEIDEKSKHLISEIGNFDLYDNRTVKNEMGKIEDLICYKFSQNSKANIYNFFREEKEIYSNSGNAKNQHQLVEKILKNYHKKSIQQTKYFIENMSGKYNQLENKPLINWENNLSLYNSLKSSFSITLNDEDNIEYILDNEELKGSFLSDLDRKYAHKKIAKIYCLEKYVEDMEEDYKSYFITFTNPSDQQYYTKIDKNTKKGEMFDFANFKKNPNYNHEHGDFEESIIKSMKSQKEINKHFYHNLKKKLHREDPNIETLFTGIYEFMENMNYHSHILYWVPSQYEELINKAYDDTVEKFNLKQCKLEILNQGEKGAKGSTYISKYLTKTLRHQEKENTQEDISLNVNDYMEEIEKNDNWYYENEARLKAEKYQDKFNNDNYFNMFKRYFGKERRTFVSSNFRHTTQKKIDIMYKYLRENYPEFLQSLKDTKISIYYQLEELERNEVFTFETSKKIAFNFDEELLKSEYAKYFKEEKKKLFNTLKSEMKAIKKRQDKFNEFNYYEEMELSRKEERRTLLQYTLIKEHGIKLNTKKHLTLNYLVNYCSLKARSRVLNELKQDTNILSHIGLNEDNTNDIETIEAIEEFSEEEKELLVKSRILEEIIKTKYISIRKDSFVKKGYFNNSFDIKSKESNRKEIYSYDMYVDNKISTNQFIDLEDRILDHLGI